MHRTRRAAVIVVDEVPAPCPTPCRPSQPIRRWATCPRPPPLRTLACALARPRHRGVL